MVIFDFVKRIHLKEICVKGDIFMYDLRNRRDTEEVIL